MVKIKKIRIKLTPERSESATWVGGENKQWLLWRRSTSWVSEDGWMRKSEGKSELP